MAGGDERLLADSSQIYYLLESTDMAPATAGTVLPPAHRLEGLVLTGGWRVVSKCEKSPGATGGKYSVCYRVERDGRRRPDHRVYRLAGA